jgi:hypothetical protein
MPPVPSESGSIDSDWEFDDNYGMQVPGHVQNGVVVLDEGAFLPEGARVVVSQLSRADQESPPTGSAGELPLVSRGEPGSVHLTNERIHQILDDEDIEALKQTWNVPS